MSRMRIRKPSHGARIVTIRQWNEELADLDELIRPVVLRVNDVRGLVTIRAKNSLEILEIKKKRGLPLSDQELVTRSGSLVVNPAKLNLVQEEK